MRIRFGPCTLDLETRQLWRQDRPVHLAPKAFQLLATLALDRPKVLSKAVLHQRLWPDTFVSEANLSNLVADIRKALGEPRRIRTAHGFGYAFCADAITVEDAAPACAERPTCWLESAGRRFPLPLGEHVIGRDPDATVRLDGSTVSRRHATIIVTPEGARLEDAGSKNGTRHAGAAVTAPVSLADGDAIYIGSVLVTFRARDPVMTTDTQEAAP